MTLQRLEQRIVRLERTVAELAIARGTRAPRSAQWYLDHAGQFKGDAVYAEIVRQGRKYRESLRPKARKVKSR
jgi:hypothetical protein